MEGQNTPLSNAGFRSIGIDDGWQACGSGVNGSFHNAHGVPLVNESRFPDLARLNAKIHALGLKSGWYLNNCWCNELLVGGRAHVLQDAAAAGSYDFDEAKVDGCGPADNITGRRHCPA